MKRVLALILACMLCLTATTEVLDYDGTAPLFDEPVTISILTKTNTNLNWQEMPWFSGLFEMANVNPEIFPRCTPVFQENFSFFQCFFLEKTVDCKIKLDT